jgi:flagellar motor switch protein FliM
VPIKVLLGRTALALEQVARVQRGTIILLDTTVRDPVTAYVGETPVFEGDVWARQGRFAVRVTRTLASEGAVIGVGEPKGDEGPTA